MTGTYEDKGMEPSNEDFKAELALVFLSCLEGIEHQLEGLMGLAHYLPHDPFYWQELCDLADRAQKTSAVLRKDFSIEKEEI